VDPARPDWVWRLQKGLYGTKQGGHVWWKHVSGVLEALDFAVVHGDMCVWRRESDGAPIIIWTDDILIAAATLYIVRLIFDDLAQRLTIRLVGDAVLYLNVALRRDRQRRTLALSQVRFDCHVVQMPRGINALDKAKARAICSSSGSRARLQKTVPERHVPLHPTRQRLVDKRLVVERWVRVTSVRDGAAAEL
jgi:hypothetical protein